jgi:ABC-type multidrug transport system ATPase subunit
LSSHQLQDIETVANRMCIINKGKLVVEGKVEDLLMQHNYFTGFEVDQVDRSVQILENTKIKLEIIEKQILLSDLTFFLNLIKNTLCL